MILTKKYLKRMVREKKAVEMGECVWNDRRWMIVDRYDIQRTDHYYIGDK